MECCLACAFGPSVAGGHLDKMVELGGQMYFLFDAAHSILTQFPCKYPQIEALYQGYRLAFAIRPPVCETLADIAETQL